MMSVLFPPKISLSNPSFPFSLNAVVTYFSYLPSYLSSLIGKWLPVSRSSFSNSLSLLSSTLGGNVSFFLMSIPLLKFLASDEP